MNASLNDYKKLSSSCIVIAIPNENNEVHVPPPTPKVIYTDICEDPSSPLD
jgi:hypothetical protein